IRQTKASAKQAAGALPGWLDSARRQQDLIETIRTTIEKPRTEVRRVPLDDIRNRLNARLDEVRDRLVFGDTTDRLAVTIATLEKLAKEAADDDMARLIALGARYDTVRTGLRDALADAQGPVAGLQPSPLGALMAARLTAIDARRIALDAPAADLFDLAFKVQEMEDLRAELDGIDPAALQALVDAYQQLEADLRQVVQKDQADLAVLPPAPVTAILQAQNDGCRAAITPLAQITSPQALDHALVMLRKTDDVYRDASSGTPGQIKEIQDYLDLLRELDAAHADKVRAAGQLPASLIRTALLGSLSAQSAKRQPLADATDIRKLREQTSGLRAVLSGMQGFDIDLYRRHAAAYQDGAATLLSHIAAKTRELAALPDAGVRAILEGSLAQIEAEFLPLAQIALPAQVERKTKALADLQKRVLAIDAAGIAQAIDDHRQLLADVRQQIDDQVTRIAGAMPQSAQDALRDMFLKRHAALVTFATIEELAERTKGLRTLSADVAKHQIKTPIPPQTFARADQHVADAQGRINTMTSPKLQQAAQVALDKLQVRLDQLRLGETAEGIPASIAVGKKNEGQLALVDLKPSEVMQALDKAIKALDAALDDDTGKQMLDFEGGEKLADGLCQMYSTLVAFGANHKGVSPVEALAVQRYTGDDYTDMNLNRRGVKTDPRLKFLNETTDTALEKLPEYPDAAWPTYRAETAWSQDVVDKRYVQGRQFECGVLWSTGARGVADLSHNSPAFIHVIYGKKGRDVAALSAHSGEGGRQQPGYDFNPAAGRGEVLFPADSNFVVTERKDPPDAPVPIRFAPYKGDVTITTRLKEVSNG
ncbi:hypothetical protein, partial [Aphanothece microscopica]|uniref:hypothetical protein n=1 Tax=Aphanothece microscopica TaxID=1049561 RepID=UPI00398466F2